MTQETETTEVTPDPVEIETVEAVVETPKPKTRAKPVIKDSDDAILALRAENEKLRKKLEADSTAKAEKIAEERIKLAKEEAVADAQKKLDERIVEMEERAKARVMKSELKAAATRAGVVDFDDLFQIMQRDLKKIEFNDDGDVTNANDLITEVKKQKPHLFGGVNTTSTASVPTGREQPKSEKIALDMSKEDYQKAKAKLFAM